jgi:hypothetical protein
LSREADENQSAYDARAATLLLATRSPVTHTAKCPASDCFACPQLLKAVAGHVLAKEIGWQVDPAMHSGNPRPEPISALLNCSVNPGLMRA